MRLASDSLQDLLFFTIEVLAIGSCSYCGGGARGVSPLCVRDSIVAGRKTATVRFRDPLQVGPAVFSFDDGHTVRRLDGEVKGVNARKVATLTDDDAHREDFEDRDLFLAALSVQYPDLNDNDVVDVVSFQIVKP